MICGYDIVSVETDRKSEKSCDCVTAFFMILGAVILVCTLPFSLLFAVKVKSSVLYCLLIGFLFDLVYWNALS